MINLGHFQDATASMGPGLRACVWVRGCSINCKGCATPQLIPATPTRMVRVEEVLERILASHGEHQIEGVSFSGGEPFEQAPALARLAASAREHGLSTLSWSGYTRAYLESGRAPTGSAELLAHLDVLIDGAYVLDQASGTTPLRGSTNQVIHFLTSRYGPKDIGPRRITVRVTPDGLRTEGVGDYTRLGAIMRLLGAK